MSRIQYIRGDATCPQAAGNKVIAHVCNDAGKWGAGFVLALSARWEQPEAEYRAWANGKSEVPFSLGAVQVVPVLPTVWVANMVAQHGTRTGSSGPPIRYPALDQCLAKLAEVTVTLEASVHMPRIGCGLAGGDWAVVEPLIEKNLCDRGVSVTVYDFEK